MINKLLILKKEPHYPLKVKQGERGRKPRKEQITKPSSPESMKRIEILTKYFPLHIINYGNRVYQSLEAYDCTLEELLQMERFYSLMDVKQPTNNPQ